MRNTVETNGKGFFNVSSFSNKNHMQKFQMRNKENSSGIVQKPVIYSNDNSCQNSFRKTDENEDYMSP
jgi:hypothetical protein